MSVKFSDVCKIAGPDDIAISHNPGATLFGFWPLEEDFSVNYLYTLKASELSQHDQLENCNLLIYADVPVDQGQYMIESLNCIISQSEEDFAKLQARVRTLFDDEARIENYTQELVRSSQQENSILQMMNICYNQVSNPILLTDASFCPLHHIGVRETVMDATIEFGMKQNYFSLGLFNEFTNGTHHYPDTEYPQLQIVDPYPEGLSESQIIVCPVISQKQVISYLAMFAYNHAFSDADKKCLIILSDFVSLISADQTSDSYSVSAQIEDFLISVLSQRLIDEDAIEQRCNTYHLNTTDSHVLLCIQPSVLELPKEKILSNLKRQLWQNFNVNLMASYMGSLYLVIESDHLSYQDDFIRFLQENDCICAVSLPFNKYTRLYMSYQQTLACMTMHTAFRLEEPVIRFSEWKYTYMILRFQEVCSLTDLINDDVKYLFELDTQKDSNLTMTLFSYILNRQDITNTAKYLHMHYNTVKYRLQKITDLTNIDFGDPDIMYQIILSEKVLHLMDLLEHRRNDPI